MDYTSVPQTEKTLGKTMPNWVTPVKTSAMVESKSTNDDKLSAITSADTSYRTTLADSTNVLQTEMTSEKTMSTGYTRFKTSEVSETKSTNIDTTSVSPATDTSYGTLQMDYTSIPQAEMTSKETISIGYTRFITSEMSKTKSTNIDTTSDLSTGDTSYRISEMSETKSSNIDTTSDNPTGMTSYEKKHMDNTSFPETKVTLSTTVSTGYTPLKISEMTETKSTNVDRTSGISTTDTSYIALQMHYTSVLRTEKILAKTVSTEVTHVTSSAINESKSINDDTISDIASADISYGTIDMDSTTVPLTEISTEGTISVGYTPIKTPDISETKSTNVDSPMDFPTADTPYATLQMGYKSVPQREMISEETISPGYTLLKTSEMSETKSTNIDRTLDLSTGDTSYRTAHMDNTSFPQTEMTSKEISSVGYTTIKTSEMSETKSTNVDTSDKLTKNATDKKTHVDYTSFPETELTSLTTLSPGYTPIKTSVMTETKSTNGNAISDISTADTSNGTTQMDYTSFPQMEKTLAKTMTSGVTPVRTYAMIESKSTNVDTISDIPSADTSYRTTHTDFITVSQTEISSEGTISTGFTPIKTSEMSETISTNLDTTSDFPTADTLYGTLKMDYTSGSQTEMTSKGMMSSGYTPIKTSEITEPKSTNFDRTSHIPNGDIYGTMVMNYTSVTPTEMTSDVKMFTGHTLIKSSGIFENEFANTDRTSDILIRESSNKTARIDFTSVPQMVMIKEATLPPHSTALDTSQISSSETTFADPIAEMTEVSNSHGSTNVDQTAILQSEKITQQTIGIDSTAIPVSKLYNIKFTDADVSSNTPKDSFLISTLGLDPSFLSTTHDILSVKTPAENTPIPADSTSSGTSEISTNESIMFNATTEIPTMDISYGATHIDNLPVFRVDMPPEGTLSTDYTPTKTPEMFESTSTNVDGTSDIPIGDTSFKTTAPQKGMTSKRTVSNSYPPIGSSRMSKTVSKPVKTTAEMMNLGTSYITPTVVPVSLNETTFQTTPTNTSFLTTKTESTTNIFTSHPPDHTINQQTISTMSLTSKFDTLPASKYITTPTMTTTPRITTTPKITTTTAPKRFCSESSTYRSYFILICYY